MFASNKQDLRRRMRALRSSLSPEERRQRSIEASTHLAAWSPLQNARVVAIYAAINTEIDPSTLAHTLSGAGVKLAYPRIDDPQIAFHIATASELRLVRQGTGKVELWEPSAQRPTVQPDEIDVCIVPGLAFSSNGDRLGYGGGYYDRFLSSLRNRPQPGVMSPPHRGATSVPVTVGLAFAAQIVDRWPRDPWDQRIDAIATENGIFPCNTSTNAE